MGFEYIEVKTVLNRHKRRDPWFQDDYSVNPYKGCSFNCLYCYTLGSRYGQAEPGRVVIKANSPDILRKELSRRARKEQFGFIAISSSTEPYMKIEENLGLTREILKIIKEFRFPVVILTKSTLVQRDFDLIREIGEKAILPPDTCARNGAYLVVSISTLDEKLAKELEPGAPSPLERLEIVEMAKNSGISAGVAFIPVLPFISDSEETLDKMISEVDFADFIFVGSLTLFGKGPYDSKTRYYRFLERNYPELVKKYRSLFRIFPSPPKDYMNNLLKISRKLAEKHSINLGLPDCKI